MALTDKLRNLDQKLLPGTRGDEEDAESYLRRVAASRAITPAQAGDVMAALRQYFGVEEGESAEGESAEDGTEQTDEAGEDSSDDDDDNDENDDEDADESDESDEKKEDDES
jgi:hypothetical protein